MFDQLNDAARDIAIKIGGVDFADEAVGHSKKTIELLCKLRNARRTKNKRLQRELKNAIVKSYPVRFTAVLLKADTDNSILIPDHIREMAGKLDMFNDCGEPVRAWAEPKLPPLNDQAPTSTDANDYRPIFAFGWLRSAGQQLIVWVLEATFEVDEFNHLTKGRGPDAAAEKINQLCVNGLPFVVIADIKNCFRSVQQEGLEKVLELPKAIVSNFLLIRSTVKLLPKPLTTSIGVFGGTALSGLPQGSCASGKITGILLGPTLKSITSTDRIVLHGDDILIAASNQSEAKAFESALKKAL